MYYNGTFTIYLNVGSFFFALSSVNANLDYSKEEICSDVKTCEGQ